MAKLAFVDKTGKLNSVAWTCLKDGHDVIYWITGDKEHQKIGDGLVPKAQSEKDILDFHPDVVFVYQDPHIVDSLTKKHLVAFGSTLLASKLEDERLYAASLADRYEMKVPQTVKFTNIEDVNDFLETRDGRSKKEWVFKTEGTKGGTTHVTLSDDHLRSVIKYEENINDPRAFILQERIEGIEISIEGWFDYRLQAPDGPWIKPFNSTIEQKKLMADDVGPLMGCMGSIVWAWPSSNPKLARQTLEKLTPHLTQIKYIGPIDGNFIIDYKTRTPWFLEWTPRFGWNAFESFMYGLQAPSTVGEMLVSLGRGDLRKYRLTKGYMGAVRLYAPACPDMPVYAPYDSDKRLFPKDVYFDKSTGILHTVGLEYAQNLSIVFEACGGGNTLKEACREIYEDVIPQVEMADITYRNDLGSSKMEHDIEILEAWGYITK